MKKERKKNIRICSIIKLMRMRLLKLIFSSYFRNLIGFAHYIAKKTGRKFKVLRNGNFLEKLR